MSFLQPQAFWLLFLLIIPIIIHLFQFRRYKKIKFSNVAFLKKVDETHKQQRKLKHYLILLSRMLFLSALIICLARPFKPQQKSFNETVTAILDNSASSGTLIEGTPNSVNEALTGMINELDDASNKLNLNFIDVSGEKVVAYEALSTNGSITNLPLQTLLATEDNTNRFILASDFQKYIVDDNIDIFKDSSKQFILVPAHRDQPNTVKWDSVYLKKAKELAINDELMIRILSTAQTAASQIAVLEGEDYLGSSALTETTGITGLLNFTISKQDGVSYRELEIAADDPQTFFDNRLYVTLKDRAPTKTIYLFNDSPNTFIAALFSANELYNYQALNIQNYAFQNLDDYEVVVAELHNDLSLQQLLLLQQFAESVGKLILIPSAGFSKPELLNTFNLNELSINNDEQTALAAPDYNNPFFDNIFRSREQMVDMPTAGATLKWRNRAPILSFKDGSPFLDRINKNGQLYLFSTPLNNTYTDFGKSPLFLPIFYKMTLDKGRPGAIHYHYLNQDLIDISYLKVPRDAVIKLVSEDIEIIPDQRERDGKRLLIIPKNTLQPGFYKVLNAKNDSAYHSIALNYPKQENFEDHYTLPELEAIFDGQSNVKILDDFSGEALSSFINESKGGFPLWKYFLIVALLSLLAEVLIIRFFK